MGNDTGGAICQFVLDTDASRIGRLVLTNCDAFDNFPPAPFDTLFKSFRSAGGDPCADGADEGHGGAPLPAGLRDAGRRPGRRPDARVGRALPDATPTCAATPPSSSAPSIRASCWTWPPASVGFERPVLLVWGTEDRFFKLDFARRLADVFPDARLVEIEGGRTFVPLDHPERLAGRSRPWRP